MDSNEHKMSKHEWIMFNHQKKLDKVIEQNRFYCFCGHSVRILPSEERVFCNFCGHWVYRDKKKQRKNCKRIEKEYQEKRERIKRERFKNELKERIIDGRKKDLI